MASPSWNAQHSNSTLPKAHAFPPAASCAAREDTTPRQWKQWADPTPEERQHMAAHRIVYEHGRYRYGPYRYDLLPAALAYAQHAPGISRPGG
jgi:hypothetical protein